MSVDSAFLIPVRCVLRIQLTVNHVIGPPQAEPGFQKQTVTSETDALPEETVPQDAAMLQDLVPSLARTDSAPSSSQDFRDVADALM